MTDAPTATTGGKSEAPGVGVEVLDAAPSASEDAVESRERRLADLEANVQKNLAVIHRKFAEIGAWLAEIHDEKLYRSKGFATFNEYCNKTFGFTRQHGYRYIKGAAVIDRVKELNPAIEITNEAQARELTGLLDKPDKLKEAVKNLANSDKPLSSTRIRAAVRDVLPPRQSAESTRQKKLRLRLPAGVKVIRWENGTVAIVRFDVDKYTIAPSAGKEQAQS